MRKENFSNPQKYARTIAKYSFKLYFFSVKEYHCVYILVLIRKKNQNGEGRLEACLKP